MASGSALAGRARLRPFAWCFDRPILASLALGVLAALAFAPVHALPALFGMGLWFALVRSSEDWRSAFGRALAFGFGFHLTGIHWVAIAFFTDAERFGPYAVPAVLLLALGMGLFVAAATLFVWRLGLSSPVAAALAFGVAWTASEWLRDVLTQFPWNPLGSVWAFSPWIVQPAAWIGVYGLSLLTATVAVLPAAAFERRGLRPAALGLAALAVLVGVGALRPALLAPAEPPGPYLRIVQGNVPQPHKWDPELRARWFERHLRLAAEPSPYPLQAIVWPESASSYLMEDDPVARELIARTTPAGGATITGGERFDLSVEPPLGWNTLFVVDDRAELWDFYDKVDLVPFGEFLPFRPVLSLLGLGNLTGGMFDFQRGPGRVTMEAPGLPPFSPLICYEVIFTGRVLAEGPRPEWLLNITNDAWFGTSAGPFQHFAMARLRAVEEGLPLVRAANTGISAVIDAVGRTRAQLDLNETGVIDAELPAPLAAPTLYARLGLLAPLLLGLLLAGSAAVAERRARKGNLF